MKKNQINGQLEGIRNSYIKRLEAIYDMESDRNQFVAAEILDTLAFFTDVTGREAMVYLDRGGNVITIYVGESDRVSLPALRMRRSEMRLCGIRCIHTHPGGNSHLSEVDLQSLKSLRLDAMAAVGIAEGRPAAMQIGILASDEFNDELSVSLFGPYVLKRGDNPLSYSMFSDGGVTSDDEIWDEIRNADNHIRPIHTKKGELEIARAILVGINASSDELKPLYELRQLADTAGFITVGTVTQAKSEPDKSYYLGYGKMHDLALQIQALRADTVIFDDELTPAQIKTIQNELGKNIEILDRTALILDIFSGRASTHEGRLQVELAKTKYLLPRMSGYWTHLSRMGGGGGGSGAGARRGEGETQLEVDRRLLRRRLNELEREIDKVKSHRNIQRISRQRSNIPIVAIVGYTNAGKSTLLNLLSGANVLSEDKLFATLDPVSRCVNFGAGEFLIIDTVGFINKLSHDLVDAFRATLEETRYADLLLHVVDASSVDREKQMKVVDEVLNELGVVDKPIITVYNKCDITDEQKGDFDLTGNADTVNVSAMTGFGIDALKSAVTKKLAEMRTEVSVILPLDAGALVSRIYSNGEVIECEYMEDGIHLRAIVAAEDEAKLQQAVRK